MTGIIILAAGESSRLGRPKQNLLFNGQTLLQSALYAAQQSNCEPVLVVLGANADQIALSVDANILYNKDWSEGIASSIRMAIGELEKYPAVTSVILMLCDQPFVSASILNALISKQTETGKLIIACTYNGTTGVPALFDCSLFAELRLLQGQEGAKKLLKAYAGYIATVPFEQGNIDVDTPEDYEKLRKINN
jgi:molybdenum cofactor cytidylyltransferase